MKTKKVKYKSDIGLGDIYSEYKKSVKNPLNRSDFMKTMYSFLKNLVKGMIEESMVFKLPFFLGTIGIKKYDAPDLVFGSDGKIDHNRCNISIDFGETNKLWKEYPELKEQKKVIYHENEHTDGKRVKIKWNYVTFRGYTFSPCRNFKRSLAKFIKLNPNTEYYDF